MPKDLYKTLNVEKGASKKEINGAFKKLMVIHHPDKNGGQQSAEFDDIRRAYETLHNDQSRKMYDDFGVVPGDEESSRKAQVIAALCGVFAQIVTQLSVEQLERYDLINAMRQQISQSKQGLLKQKKDMEKKLEEFKLAHKVMQKRLKHKIAGGQDFLMRAIEENIASFPSNIINSEKQAKMHDDMLAMLAEYEYEFERTAQHSPYGSGSASLDMLAALNAMGSNFRF